MLTIEHPLTGAKLQVANKDFSDQMTWNKAIDACEKLGSGWRLPTIEELEAIYEQLHNKGQGNFKESDYWSSAEMGNLNAKTFSFSSGNDSWLYLSKSDTYYARAVRTF
jgi:hypothetical protein